MVPPNPTCLARPPGCECTTQCILVLTRSAPFMGGVPGASLKSEAPNRPWTMKPRWRVMLLPDERKWEMNRGAPTCPSNASNEGDGEGASKQVQNSRAAELPPRLPFGRISIVCPTLAISCEGRTTRPWSLVAATPRQLTFTMPRPASKPPLVSFIALFGGAKILTPLRRATPLWTNRLPELHLVTVGIQEPAEASVGIVPNAPDCLATCRDHLRKRTLDIVDDEVDHVP